MGGAAMSLVGKAAKLHGYEWLDLARAAAELAFARVRLGRESAEDLLAGITSDSAATPSLPGTAVALRVQRVANAIGRASSRVPWRSDCLVRALAAQRWLCRMGVATKLFIGVRATSIGGVDAHAWLTCGDVVVTGGDISPYTPLVSPGVVAALRSGVPR